MSIWQAPCSERCGAPHMIQRVTQAFSGAASAWAVLALALVVTAVVGAEQFATSNDLARLRFRADTEEARVAIQHRLDTYLDMIRASRALFASSDEVTRDEWAAFVTGLDPAGRFPGIVGMNFVRRVSHSARETYIDRVRQDTSVVSEGYPYFEIWPSGDRKSVV